MNGLMSNNPAPYEHIVFTEFDGVEGILVSPGNVGELASAILEFYRHPEKVERMGVAARQRVVENFTWDHFRTRLLSAYGLAMQMGG